MSALTTYRTAVLTIEAVNSNPNGDPAANGQPRRSTTGYGEISAVSTKRKIRNLMEDKKGAFWLATKAKYNLDEAKFDIFESTTTDENAAKKWLKDNGREAFFSRYFDCRVFGVTFIPKGDGASGVKATGPFAVHDALTTHPINTVGKSLTRARDQGDEKKTFAPDARKLVEYACYSQWLSVIPSLGAQTGMTETDCNIVFDALAYIYALNPSTARPCVSVLNAWVFDHGSPLPKAREIDIANKLAPRVVEAGLIPSKREDYHFATPESAGLVGEGKVFTAAQVKNYALPTV